MSEDRQPKSYAEMINMEQVEARIEQRFGVKLAPLAREEVACYLTVTEAIRKMADARDTHLDLVLSGSAESEESYRELAEFTRTLKKALDLIVTEACFKKGGCGGPQEG